jgi:hypothetical protein
MFTENKRYSTVRKQRVNLVPLPGNTGIGQSSDVSNVAAPSTVPKLLLEQAMETPRLAHANHSTMAVTIETPVGSTTTACVGSN